jgi:predicted nucleic acid-binding protein
LSKLVVDASAAVQIALIGVRPAGLDRYECVAPPLMWSEALSVLAEGAYRGDIPAGTVGAALDRLESLEIARIDVEQDHRRRALELTQALGWAKSYDAEYVALAQFLKCPLLTIDGRLARGAAHLIQFVPLAEFA